MTGPTERSYYVGHATIALQSIVDRYTADSAAMLAHAPSLAEEALAIANAAWSELARRWTEHATARPPAYPEDVLRAARAVLRSGLRELETYPWYQYGADDWLVATGHPLAMEPGTGHQRFVALVREALNIGVPLPELPVLVTEAEARAARR